MRLAKQHLDVGLYTNEREAQLRFWEHEVGLPFDHMGKLGGGVQQHRFHMNGSIMKVNHARDPLPDLAPSGIVGLRIAQADCPESRRMADPDDNRVTVVPPGTDGVDGIAVELRVTDAAAHDRFWTHVMQFDRAGDGSYRCGDSLVTIVDEGPVAERPDVKGPGFRYLTVQIWDCLAEYDGVLKRGGRSGGEPRVLGDTVRFAWVLDPDGNHIELSQRASLTGGSL